MLVCCGFPRQNLSLLFEIWPVDLSDAIVALYSPLLAELRILSWLEPKKFSQTETAWLTLKEKNKILQLSGGKVIKIRYFLCSKVLPKFTMMVQQVSQRAIASRFGVSQAAVSIITKKKAYVFEFPQISYFDLVCEVDSINLDKRIFRDKLRQVRVAGGAAGSLVDICFIAEKINKYCTVSLQLVFNCEKPRKTKNRNFTAIARQFYKITVITKKNQNSTHFLTVQKINTSEQRYFCFLERVEWAFWAFCLVCTVFLFAATASFLFFPIIPFASNASTCSDAIFKPWSVLNHKRNCLRQSLALFTSKSAVQAVL